MSSSMKPALHQDVVPQMIYINAFQIMKQSFRAMRVLIACFHKRRLENKMMNYFLTFLLLIVSHFTQVL